MAAGKHEAPRSWAEDVQQYRSTRGSQALSTVHDAAEPVQHRTRTHLRPFADLKHPLYSYEEPVSASAAVLKANAARYERQGLGDNTLLQDGLPGPHRAQHEQPSGRAAVPNPAQKEDMLEVLQCRNAGAKPDAWFGNTAIDPSDGKKAVTPPFDSKGRKDLFQVLCQKDPAPASSDSWMGHTLIDPSKGKRSCPGPEQRMGRPNLFPLIQNNILRDPDRAQKMKGACDGPFADAWIGHSLIHPAKGKLAQADSVATQASLAGGALRANVCDPDFGKPGRRAIPPHATCGHAQHDTIQAIRAGTATHDDWHAAVKSRRHFDAVPRRQPQGTVYRVDLGDVLSGQQVDGAEAARNAARWAEDADVSARQRVAPPPAYAAAAAGVDILH